MAVRIRSLLLLLVLLALALIIAIWPHIVAYGVQYSLKSARSPRFNPVWTGMKGTWQGVHIDSVDTLLIVPTDGKTAIKSVPVKLSLQNVWVKPSILSALLNQQALGFSAEIFGGSISGSLSSVLGEPSASIAASGIDLSQLALFPEVRATGIRTGTIEGTASMSKIVPGEIPDSTFSVSLRDFTLPPNQLTSILKLDPSEKAQVMVSGSTSRDAISVESLTIQSSLGKIRLKGTAVGRIGQRIERVEATTGVELTQHGVEALGAWLPLVTNNSIASNTTNFTVRTTTAACSGKSLYALQLRNQTLCFSNQFERGKAIF